jgi:hypothetical protein
MGDRTVSVIGGAMTTRDDRLIDDQDFSDLAARLGHGDMPSEDEPEETTETSEAPEVTEPEEKPEAEPEETEEPEATLEEPEAEGADEPEVETEGVDAEAKAEPPVEDEPKPALDAPEGYLWKDGQLFAEIIVDGQKYEVPAEETRKGYMRQADYTRKTQALSAHEKDVAAALTDQRSLIGEMQENDVVREFISQYPDATGFLLEKPVEARRLMQNRREWNAFAEDYKLMAGNPKLAKAYLDSSTDPEAAQTVQDERDEVQLRREAENLTNFAYNLDNAVANLAKEEFDGIDETEVESVLTYLSGTIGGFDAKSTPQDVLNGMRKLATVVTKRDGSGWDLALVRDRFAAISAGKERAEAVKKSEVEEHNESVDAELAEQKKRAPATPEGGGAAASPEKVPVPASFEEAVQRITQQD